MTTSFIHLLIYLHYHRRSSKPQYNQLAPPGGWCSLDPCAMADDPEFFRLKLNIAPLKKRLIVETFVCMCMCQNVHNIKLTVLTILKCAVLWHFIYSHGATVLFFIGLLTTHMQGTHILLEGTPWWGGSACSNSFSLFLSSFLAFFWSRCFLQIVVNLFCIQTLSSLLP